MVPIIFILFKHLILDNQEIYLKKQSNLKLIKKASLHTMLVISEN